MELQTIGRRASRVGERLGWNWLIYNPAHFLHYHEAAVIDAPAAWDAMQACFPTAMSFADVGAGSGAYAAEGARRGFRVIAFERDRFGRLLARRQGVNVASFDLPSSRPEGGFDVAYCFEVAEHLPLPLGDRLIDYLCGQASEILFTAAPPGQGGTGHINEQPPEYWEERFARHGRNLDRQRTQALRTELGGRITRSYWLAKNAMVFTRGT